MRELISQSLSGIRDIIPGQSYAIIKARLDQLLPKDAAISFAKVDIQGSEGTWYSETNYSYKPYSEASDLEKEEIATALEILKEIAYGKLKTDMPYWENLFVVPNKECVFWFKDQEKMYVILAQWGFDIRSAEKQINVISDLITAPRPLTQVPVTLECKYTNGDPATEFEFSLLIFNNRKLCKTDANGKYYIGSLFADKSFAVEDTDGNQHQEFTVSKDKVYDPVFELYTGYQLLVVDQDNESLPNYSVNINDDTFITDENGLICVNNVVLYVDSKIVVTCNEKVGEFKLGADPEQNKFKVIVKLEKVAPPMQKYVIIKLQDYKGKSLPNLAFKVTSTNGNVIEGKTDELGKAVLPADQFENGKKYNISFEMSLDYQKNRK